MYASSKGENIARVVDSYSEKISLYFAEKHVGKEKKHVNIT